MSRRQGQSARLDRPASRRATAGLVPRSAFAGRRDASNRSQILAFPFRVPGVSSPEHQTRNSLYLRLMACDDRSHIFPTDASRLCRPERPVEERIEGSLARLSDGGRAGAALPDQAGNPSRRRIIARELKVGPGKTLLGGIDMADDGYRGFRGRPDRAHHRRRDRPGRRPQHPRLADQARRAPGEGARRRQRPPRAAGERPPEPTDHQSSALPDAERIALHSHAESRERSASARKPSHGSDHHDRRARCRLRAPRRPSVRHRRHGVHARDHLLSEALPDPDGVAGRGACSSTRSPPGSTSSPSWPSWPTRRRQGVPLGPPGPRDRLEHRRHRSRRRCSTPRSPPWSAATAIRSPTSSSSTTSPRRAIDKSSRFTDWSRRPLTEAQLTYALSDVTHLVQVYEALRRSSRRTGGWLARRGDGGPHLARDLPGRSGERLAAAVAAACASRARSPS